MSKKCVKAALKTSLPVLAAYFFLGIGFGVLLRKAGFGLLWAFVMALTMLSGTMQYVCVSLFTENATLFTAGITTLLVNCRYAFYGLSMNDQYKNAGFFRRLYMLHSLTDETYALLCDAHYPEGEDPYQYWFLVHLFNQCYWIVGCMVGSILGAALPFDTTGIDFIMTAMFVTVFVDQWKAASIHLPAISGVVVTALCLLVFGPDKFLIPTMIGIVAMLIVSRKKVLAKMPELLENRAPEQNDVPVGEALSEEEVPSV